MEARGKADGRDRWVIVSTDLANYPDDFNGFIVEQRTAATITAGEKENLIQSIYIYRVHGI